MYRKNFANLTKSFIVSFALIAFVGCNEADELPNEDVSNENAEVTEITEETPEPIIEYVIEDVTEDFNKFADGLKRLEVNEDNVTIYAGPADTYMQLGILNKGDVIEAIGEDGEWFVIVDHSNNSCYIKKYELVEVLPTEEVDEKDANDEILSEKEETEVSEQVPEVKNEEKTETKEEPKPEEKESQKEEKITIPSSFDAEFYAKNNPDVVAACGNSPEALYKHYLNYGKKEGRAQNASEAASNPQQQVVTNPTQPSAPTTGSGQYWETYVPQDNEYDYTQEVIPLYDYLLNQCLAESGAMNYSSKYDQANAIHEYVQSIWINSGYSYGGNELCLMYYRNQAGYGGTCNSHAELVCDLCRMCGIQASAYHRGVAFDGDRARAHIWVLVTIDGVQYCSDVMGVDAFSLYSDVESNHQMYSLYY